MMFAGFSRPVVVSILVALGLAAQPSVVLGQGQVGPSFDCAGEAARTQVLPRMICASSELSRLELTYIAAYQALRHSFGDQERGALFREAQASTERMTRDCNLPATGARAATPQEVACLRGLYLEFIAGLQRRAGPDALDEARMTPEQLIAVQTALKARGLLPAASVADGVLGPQSRAAIVAWQQAAGGRVNGFASPVMLSRLVPPAPASPPAPAAPPAQAAPSAPAAPSPTPSPSTAPPSTASVAPPATPAPSPSYRARGIPSASHPVLPMQTQLPAIDMRLCPTREAAEQQARASTTTGAEPVTRAPCEHRPAVVELVRPEPGIAPYRALIARATLGASAKFGFMYDGETHTVSYDWEPGEVRVWEVRVLERDGTLERGFAEIPERPIEIAFLTDRGAWPPKSGQKTVLQSCPAGPSAWLEDKRTSCKVWNPCPQRGETVEWTGRCEGGFAEGTGTTLWRYAGVVNRHDSVLKGGKALEKAESFTDANGCRIANWIGAATGTTVSWSGPCVEGQAQGDGKLEWSGTGITSGTYAGRMVGGQPDGYGVMTLVTGVSYDGRWASGKRDGQGRLTYLNGNRYDGDWKEGRQTGRGVFTWKDGGRYDGEWRDGRANGRGTMVYANGNRYEGEWRDDKQAGRGIFTWKDGGRYDGDWNDDLRAGRGTMVYADGNRYEGDWRDDKRTGRGVFTWKEGDRYDGEWRDDKRNGRGVLTWKDGARYDGQWQDDNRSGRGTMVYASRNRYEGDWRDDKRSGRGTLFYADGSRYDGEWRDDKVNGRGTMVYANGNRYEGDWRDNERSGRGTLVYPNGRRYEGEWRNDKSNGRGVLTSREGDRYDGEWKDHKRNGRGEQVFASGGRYDGQWRDDQRNGFGTQVNPSGNRYEGEWRDDRPEGFGTGVFDGEAVTGIWTSGCIRKGSSRASFTKELWECP